MAEIAAPAGEEHQDTAPVPVVGAAVDEIGGNHAVDHLGEGRRREHRVGSDLGHRAPVPLGEQAEHPPLLQGTALCLESLGNPRADAPLGVGKQLHEVCVNAGRGHRRSLSSSQNCP
ncbi:MAG TPA: hypothetical protein VKV80_21165 [Streptosporangiaceae bacterium]|nr:hypothetical protein [Streptosporangiaceae bacterium]